VSMLLEDTHWRVQNAEVFLSTKISQRESCFWRSHPDGNGFAQQPGD
jgi:hypothetical protein